MRNNADYDSRYANPHGFTIDDNGKTHDIKPIPVVLGRSPKRKRTDNPRGVSLGGRDIDKES